MSRLFAVITEFFRFWARFGKVSSYSRQNERGGDELMPSSQKVTTNMLGHSTKRSAVIVVIRRCPPESNTKKCNSLTIAAFIACSSRRHDHNDCKWPLLEIIRSTTEFSDLIPERNKEKARYFALLFNYDRSSTSRYPKQHASSRNWERTTEI
jgi:hypothetical protein